MSHAPLIGDDLAAFDDDERVEDVPVAIERIGAKHYEVREFADFDRTAIVGMVEKLRRIGFDDLDHVERREHQIERAQLVSEARRRSEAGIR